VTGGRRLQTVVELADGSDMIEHTAHIDMDAAPADVYAVAGALDWFGPDITVERLSGGEGLGGTYEVRTSAVGTRFAFVVVVDAADEPRRLGFSTVGAKECSFEGEYVIEPRTRGCHVSLHVRAKPHGRFRLMKPVLAPVMHHAMHDTLERLRARVEARPARAA
jgi:Polyketide cyclase / dehydrase and lipid transport